MSYTILASNSGGELLSDITIEELPGLLKDVNVNVWVSIIGNDPADKQMLSQVFSVHPLLVEDAFKPQPTPKIEVHEDYIFTVIHALPREPLDDHNHLQTHDVDIFLGRDYLITHQDQPGAALAELREEVAKDKKVLKQGVAYIAHRYIDRLIDEYLPLIDRFDHDVATLENSVMTQQHDTLLADIFDLKHSLQRLRRIGYHQREVLRRLWEEDLTVIPRPCRPFFRDVFDHFVRVHDMNETNRELVSSSLDAYLSIQSHQLNEKMRGLTLISLVMLPLTFLTGLYGMNFDHMPGLHWKYGYEMAWVVMISVTAVFMFFVRRKGWA